MSKLKFAELGKIYRIVINDDATHRRLRVFRFSKIGFALTIITSAVVLILGMYAILALTPLRQTIPGYPDAHFRRDAVSNAIKIDSLESIITRWELYSESLSRVLSGEESIDREAIRRSSGTKYLSDKASLELARRDSMLRRKVEAEEQFGVSGSRDKDLPITGMHFFAPCSGVVSQPFDGNIHLGTDISCPEGSTIYSVLDGTAIFEGWNDQSGYTLHIQHKGEIVTSYKHLRRVLVRPGDAIKAGTPVGILGSSGELATGDFLHFELWHNGAAIDPTLYINF